MRIEFVGDDASVTVFASSIDAVVKASPEAIPTVGRDCVDRISRDVRHDVPCWVRARSRDAEGAIHGKPLEAGVDAITGAPSWWLTAMRAAGVGMEQEAV